MTQKSITSTSGRFAVFTTLLTIIGLLNFGCGGDDSDEVTGGSPGAIYSISGTVTGDAVADVTMNLSGSRARSVKTDANGEYSFDELPTGNYRVTPELAGYGFTNTSERVEILSADATEVDFRSSFADPNDLTPPNPNPSTWELPPSAAGSTAITMTATTAIDPSGGVEYQFHNVTNDTISDWQSSATFTAAGLTPNTEYTFEVKTRDVRGNMGDFSPRASATTLPPGESDITIDTVYFAQTHVLEPDHEYFKLVSNREALIKAHVTASGTEYAPEVVAELSLNGNTNTIVLTGPSVLPNSIPNGPGVVQHSMDDSFTGTIPAEWVKPGLVVDVIAGPAEFACHDLTIGAPTKVVMQMFDIYFFESFDGRDYANGTFVEMEAKWPVAELEVRRLPQIVFPELVIAPRGGVPAARISSPAEYLEKTGIGFDGEQAAALQWKSALKAAGGRSGRMIMPYVNIYQRGSSTSGGQAGGFGGVGVGGNHGVLHHELGHALSLPHWGGVATYPYQGKLPGIDIEPRPLNSTHVGPTWGFYLPEQRFIQPTVANPDDLEYGKYKVDPMQGGGASNGEQEEGFLLGYFSDYSVLKMQNYLEGHVLVWNESLNSYARWDQNEGDYTSVISNNGVQFPIERDVEVISVMASISGSNTDVNMVYPPIGPYTGNLIKRFDPTKAADREEAQSIFAPANGCDVSFKITQGGVEKTYMVDASWDPDVDILSGGSLQTKAINLPAADGEVTHVELLRTPDAEINGLPANPEVLYVWDLAQVGAVSGLQLRRFPNGIYLDWDNKWEYTGIEIRRNGTLLETLSADAVSYLDITAPSTGTLTYKVIPVRNSFRFNVGEQTIDMGTTPIAPVIYEPFTDLNLSLTGNTPGSGLVGEWFTHGINHPTGKQEVVGTSLTFGSLPVSGGQTIGNNGKWPLMSIATLGEDIKLAGLMSDGAELWFSFLLKNGDTSYVDVLIGTEGFLNGNLRDGGQAIGAHVNKTAPSASTFPSGQRTLAETTGNIPVSTTALVVGKITWATDASAADTVKIYLPDTNLALPGSPASTATAVLDQSQFDTLCIYGANDGAANVDEIRFGSSYQSVIGR